MKEVSNAVKQNNRFFDEHKKTIKFIPDSKEIFQRTYKLIIMTLFSSFFKENSLK
jgi:hypothetical protein